MIMRAIELLVAPGYIIFTTQNALSVYGDTFYIPPIIKEALTCALRG